MKEKTIIVITGKLASGKTTLADALKMDLSIPCYIKDIYKENLVDQYGFSNREENRALSVKAVDLMLEEATKDLKNNKSIILEANFREDEITRIYELSIEYGYKVVLFLLTGDDNVLYQRFLLRVPGRHIAHLSIGLDKDFNKFKEYNFDLANQVLNYPYIALDSSKNSSGDILKIVKSYL